MKIKTFATIRFYWETERFFLPNRKHSKGIKLNLSRNSENVTLDKLKLNLRKQILVPFLSQFIQREIKYFNINDLTEKEDFVFINGVYRPVEFKNVSKDEDTDALIKKELSEIKLELESQGWKVFGEKVIDYL